jgi:hypothetical protein
MFRERNVWQRQHTAMTTMKRPLYGIEGVLTTAFAVAQTDPVRRETDALPKFEVASIKPFSC